MSCFHTAFITSFTAVSDNQVPHWLNYQIHPHHLSDDNGLHVVLNYIHFSHCSFYLPDIFNVFVPTLTVSNFGSLKWCVTQRHTECCSQWHGGNWAVCPMPSLFHQYAILSMDTIHKNCQILLQHISFKEHIMCCNSLSDILFPPWLYRQIFPLSDLDRCFVHNELLNKILLIAITMHFTMANSNVLFAQNTSFTFSPNPVSFATCMRQSK